MEVDIGTTEEAQPFWLCVWSERLVKIRTDWYMEFIYALPLIISDCSGLVDWMCAVEGNDLLEWNGWLVGSARTHTHSLLTRLLEEEACGCTLLHCRLCCERTRRAFGCFPVTYRPWFSHPGSEDGVDEDMLVPIFCSVPMEVERVSVVSCRVMFFF